MQNIDIDLITVNGKRRELGDIDALADSIAAIGLINPITVSENYKLIAGLHRLEACRLLGWMEIPVVVLSLNEIDTRLAEIDENLIRNELNVLERGEQLKARKDLYEAKFPETKVGAKGGKGNAKPLANESAESAFSFVKDTAAKTNKSTRTVSEDVQIANRIAEPVRDAIRHTPLADKKGELLALSQVDAGTQTQIAEKIVSGEAATVNQAINQIYPRPAKPKTNDNTSSQWMNSLMDCLAPVKLIRERDGGISNLTKNWSFGNKQVFLDALEMIVKNYGELAAELGDIIENEK